MSMVNELDNEKKRIRAEVFRHRKLLEDRTARSREVLGNWNSIVDSHAVSRVVSRGTSQRAQRVLFYLSQHSEVETHDAVHAELAVRGSAIIPYCEGESLRLFELRSWDELELGAYGILEPTSLLRSEETRQVAPADIDIAMIPGVAFDELGGRLGHGKGYYDRLLSEMTNVVSVGISFDVQMFPSIPMAKHDIALDFVVTESTTVRVNKD
jgi:5-formyltetrahydrofolate cyclo-ligase